MCEYCQEPRCDVKDLIDTMIKTSYRTGKIPGIRAYVDGYPGETKIEIISISDTYEPSWQEASIPINFCPMCGRDLRIKESED